MQRMSNIIQVSDLTVQYGSRKVVDKVNLCIEEGEIFGMIGPNGAGKTTTIECIEGLRDNYQGAISVLGIDPRRERQALYRKIGVQLQETSYPDKVKVVEICRLFSLFYENPTPYEELLTEFDLLRLQKSFVSQLSGGERQKLSIVLALIPSPKLVFLDELTTGLDPKSRHTMWDMIKGLKQKKITVYLTTHFMEEAEVLCDRVAIMNQGQIVAMDEVSRLIDALGLPNKVVFSSPQPVSKALEQIAGVSRVETEGNQITLYGKDQDMLVNVLNYLRDQSIPYDNLRVIKPNLEDAFLGITGQKINEQGNIH